MSDSASYDAIVIGGGPAGLTAGLYLARAGKKTLLLEATRLGGQIVTAERLENYPGFPEGVSGEELISRFEAQAVRFGLEIQFGRVDALRERGAEQEVEVSGFPFRSRVVVVATGLQQKLGIPGEEEYLGRGVSYCATCDGALYRGRPVAVVGASDWAMEEALFLTRFASPVHLVLPGPELRPSSEARRQLLAHPSVRVVGSSRPLEILGDPRGVTGLRIGTRGRDASEELAVDAVFAFAGKKTPGTDFLRGVVALDEDGYAVTGADCETSRPGVYAVGDVRRSRFHQVAVAVGDGAVAGMSAVHALTGNAG